MTVRAFCPESHGSGPTWTTCTSKAPISTKPLTMRGWPEPRWSVVRGLEEMGSTARALSPAPMAGLPGRGLGRPAVVLQVAEVRIGRDRRCEVVGTAIVQRFDQVMAAGENTGADVDDVVTRAVGHDGVV